MFSIEMLPAGHGDGLVVEYGSKAAPRRILIDAGTYHSWDEVRSRLIARKDTAYELFVITHVDEDHIGGSLALLDDAMLTDKIRDIWFNGYRHIEKGSSVLGPVNGEQLTKRIVDGPYTWNEGFSPAIAPGLGGPIVVPTKDVTNFDGSQGLPAFPLPGVEQVDGETRRIVLLSPSGPKLKKMRKEWEKAVDEAFLGAGADGHNRAPRPRTKVVAPPPPGADLDWLEEVSAKPKKDTSEANGSSIAFIVEFGGKRMLLGADAHPDQLLAGVKRFGAMVGEARPRIDLFKLAHHGSAGNVTRALIESIDCQRYLVSSNGDNFGHPDDGALASVILGTAGPTEFLCNYTSDRTSSWKKVAARFDAKVTLPKAKKAGLKIDV